MWFHLHQLIPNFGLKVILPTVLVRLSGKVRLRGLVARRGLPVSLLPMAPLSKGVPLSSNLRVCTSSLGTALAVWRFGGMREWRRLASLGMSGTITTSCRGFGPRSVSLFLSNSSCLSFAASCVLLRWLDVIEAALVDLDDEALSVPVDAADFVEVTILVTAGPAAPPVSGQAVRWCDCSFLGVESCRTPRRNPCSIVEYAGDGSRLREW